uniref:Sugar phosphate transporter domain-containing protein n=1 Tax=Oryza brachyantha TaxID=4533 RepID=J3KU89_ORYBR
MDRRTSRQQPRTLLVPTNCSMPFLYARAPTTAGVTHLAKPRHQSFRSCLAQMGGAGDDGDKVPVGNDKSTASAMEVVSSSSSSPAPAPSVLKSVLLSYAYVSVWITLSFSVIVYNKYILDPKMYNWPFPVSLTMIHMAFCASLAVALTSALTMNVAGVVKDWLLIAFSWTVIKDIVTPVNLVGYGIAFLGVAYYNHAKLQGLKAKEVERTAASMAAAKGGDAEAGARLLPEKDAGDQKN